MVSQIRGPRKSDTTAQRNGWLARAVALSCFFLWFFFVLFNDLFFGTVPSVLAAIRSYGIGLAVTGIVLVGLFFAVKAKGRSSLSPRKLQLAALVFALIHCGVKAAAVAGLIDGESAALFMTLAAGTSLALFVPAAFSLLGELPLAERFAALIAVLTITLVAFCLVLLLPKPMLRLGVLIITLFVGALCCVLDQRPTTAPSLLHARFDKRLRTAFSLLLFGGSLLCSYELNAMQKTTHFISSVPEQIYFGGSSLASLLAIGLTIALLCLLLQELRHPMRSLAVLVFAMILLSIYYCLPIMSDQKSFPISFVLILSLGCTVLLLTVLLYLEPSARCESKDGRSLGLLTACTIMVIGALVGVALAYGLMDRLETFAFVSQVLSFLPAVMIFSLVGCLLFYRKDLMAIALPPCDEPALEKLDTSNMDGRCQLFAQKYRLTKRETEVLKLISQGRNIPGVADALVISQATAKTHLLHIYKKVGVSSRQELIELLYGDES